MDDIEKGYAGPTFETFLDEQGTKAEVYADATKRVLAWQIAEAMKAKTITKTAMAGVMKTSRSQIDRLLDPDNTTVQLDTVMKAAWALGLTVKIELI